MKKTEQNAINNECLKAIEEFNTCNDKPENIKRLDTCTAWTFTQGKYTVLKSYNTIVAFIDNETGVLYDVLRYVYGYTATSGKHIAKFRRFKHIAEFTFRYI